jgi:hypothetical protein
MPSQAVARPTRGRHAARPEVPGSARSPVVPAAASGEPAADRDDASEPPEDAGPRAGLVFRDGSEVVLAPQDERLAQLLAVAGELAEGAPGASPAPPPAPGRYVSPQHAGVSPAERSAGGVDADVTGRMGADARASTLTRAPSPTGAHRRPGWLRRAGRAVLRALGVRR